MVQPLVKLPHRDASAIGERTGARPAKQQRRQVAPDQWCGGKAQSASQGAPSPDVRTEWQSNRDHPNEANIRVQHIVMATNQVAQQPADINAPQRGKHDAASKAELSSATKKTQQACILTDHAGLLQSALTVSTSVKHSPWDAHRPTRQHRNGRRKRMRHKHTHVAQQP